MTSSLPLSMKGAITNRGVKLQAGLQLRLSENPQLYHAGKKLKRVLLNRRSA